MCDHNHAHIERQFRTKKYILHRKPFNLGGLPKFLRESSIDHPPTHQPRIHHPSHPLTTHPNTRTAFTHQPPIHPPTFCLACLLNDLPVCFHPPPVHSPATLPPPQSHSLTVHPPAHHPRNSYPSTHPSFVCLVCLFVCLSCLPGCLSACLDVYLKVCLACLSVCLACLSVCLACLFVCLSVCLFCLPGCFVCLSVCPACLFICLPIHPPFHVCLSARKPLVSTPARGVTRYSSSVFKITPQKNPNSKVSYQLCVESGSAFGS